MAGTVAENQEKLRAEIDALNAERKQQEERIAGEAPLREKLQLCQDRVNQDISREAVAERFMTNGRIFFAEGWIPAEKGGRVPEAALRLYLRMGGRRSRKRMTPYPPS